jgi:hypothetical protein
MAGIEAFSRNNIEDRDWGTVCELRVADLALRVPAGASK